MKVLFAWDFDWTLVNQNSDPWVIKKIGAGHIFRDLMTQVDEIGFTQVMHRSFQKAYLELHYTQAEIYQACSTVPTEPSLLQVVREMPMEAPHVTSIIISDANSVFINNILQHHSCHVCHLAPSDQQSSIYRTSSAMSTPTLQSMKLQERSESSPMHHLPMDVPYALQISAKAKFHPPHKPCVVYLGDGSGDYCPCTRLQSPDIIFARAHYPGKSTTAPLLSQLQRSSKFHISPHLPQQISSDGHPSVIPWKDPLELAQLLKECLCSIKSFT